MARNEKIAWIVVGGVLLLGLGAGAGLLVMASRGIRNNNPGNIRHGGSKWVGMSKTQNDPAFVQFVAPEYGIRALGILLRNYWRRYRLNTVRLIINKYAPGTENDTAAYIADVANRLGVSPDTPLDMTSPAVIRALIDAITWHENGVELANAYPAENVARGYAMAGLA